MNEDGSTQIVQINSRHPLIGDWVATDGFADVVVSIAAESGQFAVRVKDNNDGEIAEIYEVNYDGDKLSFNTHWVSNGRFIKYRFLLTAENIVDVTYTYSSQETWKRQ